MSGNGEPEEPEVPTGITAEEHEAIHAKWDAASHKERRETSTPTEEST